LEIRARDQEDVTAKAGMGEWRVESGSGFAMKRGEMQKDDSKEEEEEEEKEEKEGSGEGREQQREGKENRRLRSREHGRTEESLFFFFAINSQLGGVTVFLAARISALHGIRLLSSAASPPCRAGNQSMVAVSRSCGRGWGGCGRLGREDRSSLQPLEWERAL